MKLILSRKGFDSEYGGVPSPIFPNGKMVSIPIPWSIGSIAMGQADQGLILPAPLGQVVADLTARHKKMHDSNTRVHLDPWLHAGPSGLMPNWLPAFGQSDQAQTHLDNQGVGPGDLFLFFGWFRRVHQVAGVWRYERKCRGVHVLFGWLQVAEKILVSNTATLAKHQPWINDHPHVKHAQDISARNTIYIGGPSLGIGGLSGRFGGGGIFDQYAASRQLTRVGALNRTDWDLPLFFKNNLTYHSEKSFRSVEGGRVFMRAASKGQEFVSELGDAPNASILQWLGHIF